MEIGIQLDLGPSSLSYKDKVKFVLDRWSQLSVLRTERYLKWLDQFETESRFISGVNLPNISDEGIVAIPRGCEIQQIAIQLADSDLGTSYKRYTISKDLWELLDNDNRAALVLHELIFREAILAKNRVSMRVRFLNSVILSHSSIEEYFNASRDLNGLFLEWGWGGVELKIQPRPHHFQDAQFGSDFVNFMNSDFQTQAAWVRTESKFGLGRNFSDTFNLGLRKKSELFGDLFLRGYQPTQENDQIAAGFQGQVKLLPNETLEMGDISFRAGERSAELALRNIYDTGGVIQGLSTVFISGHSGRDDHRLGYTSECKNVETYSTWNKFGSPLGNGRCEIQAWTKTGRNTSYLIENFHTLKLWIGGLETGDPSGIDTDGRVSRSDSVQISRGVLNARCQISPSSSALLVECQGIPSHFTCNLVKDGSGTVEADIVVKDPGQLKIAYGQDPSQGNLELFLPAGQLIGYKKGWFGYSEVRLEKDDWVSFGWHDGECSNW